MKIAFVGTHSTGKTTILETFPIIFDKFKYYIIDEKARDIINSGYPLTKDGNVDAYTIWLTQKMNAEISSNGFDYDILLSDRSVIDIISYAIVTKQLPRPYISDYFINLCTDILFFQKDFYDLYVYFPIEFSMEVDDVRPKDDKYRNDVDLTIVNLMNKYNIKYLTVHGTIEERCSTIYKTILNGHR